MMMHAKFEVITKLIICTRAGVPLIHDRSPKHTLPSSAPPRRMDGGRHPPNPRAHGGGSSARPLGPARIQRLSQKRKVSYFADDRVVPNHWEDELPDEGPESDLPPGADDDEPAPADGTVAAGQQGAPTDMQMDAGAPSWVPTLVLSRAPSAHWRLLHSIRPGLTGSPPVRPCRVPCVRGEQT